MRDCLRKQKYRKKKAEIDQKAKNAKKKAKPNPKVKTKIVKPRRRKTKLDPTCSVRKQAQKAKISLPEDSEEWANTMNHLIRNATPRRRSMVNLNRDLKESTEVSKNPTELKDMFGVNKVGRPRNSIQRIRHQLAYSDVSNNLWATKSLGQYKRRNRIEMKRLNKVEAFRKKWQHKMESFLEDHSRIMPNKDIILVEGVPVAKRHLLMPRRELYKLFKEKNPTYNRKLSTFKRQIPKHYRTLSLKCRRVCVCIKDYNIEKKVEAMNQVAARYDLPENKTNIRTLSYSTVCQYEDRPRRQCVDRKCESCGSSGVEQLYLPLLQKSDKNDTVKYHQWEQVADKYTDKNDKVQHTKSWVQVQKKVAVNDLIDTISNDIELFTGHLYRTYYQHIVETNLTSDLPMDHCLVVMDFSENISLAPQDEIESAHWAIKQVTLHPIFVVRHAPESTEEEPKISGVANRHIRSSAAIS